MFNTGAGPFGTGGGSGGASDFTDLGDVPASYTGEANKFVRVKATEDGLEFVTSAASVAWGAITGTLSAQTDLQTSLDGKVDENIAITGATKTKITYDAKGLVTAGADATTADISDSLNKRYVTDAYLAVLSTTSGTNTGDQDLSTLIAKSIGTAKGDLIGFTASATPSSLAVGTNGYVLTADSGEATGLKWAASAGGTKPPVRLTIGGDNGAAIVAASVPIIYVSMPVAGTITGWRALADVSGSISITVSKDTYANFPPDFTTDKISASAPIAISSATKAEDTTLTGWTTSVSAGDVLGFRVDSASTLTLVTITITLS